VATEGEGEEAQHPATQDDPDAEVLAGEIEQEAIPEELQPFTTEWFIARSGPLPTAAEYMRYETTLPGSADRILRLSERAMDLTEKEATQRHSIETKIVDANITNQKRGQGIATFFGLVGFAAAIAFVATGQNVAAFIAVLVPLGAFISRFIRPPNGG
jgi:uncharacterized membrane protein